MNAITLRRIYGMATGVALAVAASDSLHGFMAARRSPLAFDDAYMFLRYAHNVRHGLGYSWNLDGVHTYGPTSLLWSLCTLLLSYLPTDPWTQLLIGSFLCSVAAVLMMSRAVAANAETEAMRSTLRVLPLVVLPVFATTVFAGNQFTGMETMLAMALCAALAGLTLLWSRGLAHPVAVGVAAFLLMLARPESALVGAMLPALLWYLQDGERPPMKQLALLYGIFIGAAVLQLLGCRIYFGTPVPLSVYMKGKHAYSGYRGVWHPELLLIVFLTGVQMFLAPLLLLARRNDLRLLFAFGAPLVALCLYLQTVTQIMGFNARYYAPYLPLVVVPALLLLDRRLRDGNLPAAVSLRSRGSAVAAMMLFFFTMSSEAVQQKVRHAEHRSRDEYDAAKLTVTAPQPLPQKTWQSMMTSITDDLVAPLPRDVTVAATEVGYLGERAAQANIIDIAGLNDTQIAMHGFSMDELMQRKPDVIWMPNTDYTYQRGIMYSDPALLKQYDIYASAANYGLAIRKDSPFRAAIDSQMQVFWSKTYPGFRMEDYRVSSATWSGAKHAVYGE